MPSYAGTLLLVRHGLRRDRLMAGIWVLVLVATCYASAAATPGFYTTEAERVAAAEGINGNAAIVALYGPILDVRSEGELSMTKMTVLYAVFVALLFLFLVRRHTRSDEESGLAELVGGTAVGRDAPLAAALVESAAVAVVLGLLAALVDVAGGLAVGGSLLFGATWAGIGLVAAAWTALACQLSASARTCAAIAAGGIAVAFAVRAAGDVAESWVSWLSPFGWSTRARPWSETRWWVYVLYVVLTVLLAAGAQLLRSRRDLGSGLIAARPGPVDGSPRLSEAVGVAWRLHRTMLLTWTVGVGVFGVVMGSIAPGVGDLLDSPSAQQVIERLGGEGALEKALLAAELSIGAAVVTCFALAVIGHGGADEHAGRAEQVLATATSRTRAYVATASVALLGATWLLLVAGVAAAIGYGKDLAGLAGAGLVQAPAAWVVVGLGLVAWAWRSAWTFVGWVLLVAFLTLGQIGELLGLPTWVIDLSPYAHTPQLPQAGLSWPPLLVLGAIAAGLVVVAGARYRVRDIG